jgi:hypothetical protein
MAGNPSSVTSIQQMVASTKRQEYRILHIYDSRSFDNFVRLVKILLPDMPQRQVTRLYNFRDEQGTKRTRWPTDVLEIKLLLSYLRDNLQGSFEDPTCGVKTIEQVLKEHYPNLKKVVCLDIDHVVQPTVVLDALNPMELSCVARPDFIVFSPPFEETDPYVFYMAKRCRRGMMALVAGDWLTNAPDYRRSAWNKYADTGRTHVIAGLDLVEGRKIRRTIWVVIGKTRNRLKELLKPGTIISNFHLGGANEVS